METAILLMAVAFRQRTVMMVDLIRHATSKMVLKRALPCDFGWRQDVTDIPI
jgi:hypothetical protein